MRVADGHQAGVMHLLADDSQRPNESLPSGVDLGSFRQKGKPGLELRGVCRRFPDGQPGPIFCLRASSHIAELNKNLRRDMQYLTSPMQFQDSPGSDGVLYVRRVC